MHEEQRPESEPVRQKRLDRDEKGAIVKVSVILFLIIVFVLFIIQNSDPVRVNFVFFKARPRLVWVFLACAIVGAVISWLAGRPRRRAMKRLVEEMERARKENG